MHITDLNTSQNHIPELARLHHEEWKHFSPKTSEIERGNKIRALLNTDGIPQGFLALDNDVLLGSAFLVSEDMSTRKDLSPWLAGVFVKEEHREKGIASELIKRVEEEARRSGISKLYLCTEKATTLYLKLGWQLLESCDYNGVPVNVMHKNLH